MSVVLLTLQIMLVCVVTAAVIERCQVLLFVAPVSPAFLASLSESVARADHASALRLAHEAPQRWVSRVVIDTSHADAADRREQAGSTLSDLRVEADMRLGLIRVSATLGSTLGLLSGILAIQRGFSGHGLLALSAGLAQQVAMSEALTHMAIGIGTAAFSFAAFALLRRSAGLAMAQAAQIAGRYGIAEMRRS